MARDSSERKWILWLGGVLVLAAAVALIQRTGLAGAVSPAVLALVLVFVVLVGGALWAYRRTTRFRPGGSGR